MSRLIQRITVTIEAEVVTEAEETDYGVPRSPRMLEPVGSAEITSIEIDGHPLESVVRDFPTQGTIKSLVLSRINPDDWEVECD